MNVMLRFLEYSVQYIDYSFKISCLIELFSVVKIVIDNILRCKESKTSNYPINYNAYNTCPVVN